ncbi:hypothetical protein [Paracoccus sp. ME4]|uniref:hypothetical protein n=1 Tax=Paracoccus sp. ME4 TaxID=3138066 RepID=UPI00398B28B5
MTDNATCNCCGTTFDQLFSEEGRKSSQAFGCACEVTEDRVVGHFGSVHDMTVFAFITAPLPEGHLICDTCMVGLIEAGHIRECGTQDGG